MARKFERRAVYAATIIGVLMLAGTWTFAAVVITQNPPPQSSSITVVNPNGVSFAAVQSTEMVMVTSTIAGLHSAGVPAGPGGALNSTFTNTLLPYCPAAQTCPPYNDNFSAVDTAHGLALGDEAVQISLLVNQSVQPAAAHGFDVQVELVLGGGTVYAFGDGYFDTGTSPSATMLWVVLFVDTGSTSLNPITLDHVVITINACTTATTCP
jgi:hypothetical protein